MAILKVLIIIFSLISFWGIAGAERIKDIVDVKGLGSMPLIGYGVVVGLDGSGDTSNSSPFTVNSIASMLNRLGVNISKDISSMKPKNTAAVMVTAELPSVIRPGQKLDVVVSSIGDAKSLRGGMLLVTPLQGGDGNVYAVSQGSLSVGGFSVGGRASSVTKNHPTVGRIANGAIVERPMAKMLDENQDSILLTLRNPDFSTSKRIEVALNQYFGESLAQAEDSGSVRVWNPEGRVTSLMAAIESIEVAPDHRAVVVVDEKTGTIVMGQDVKIDTVAVAHGNISVNVSEKPEVSQPNAGFFGESAGKTRVVQRTSIDVQEDEAQLVVLPKQVSLSSLVAALNAVGATPNDLIAVLHAIKAAGALHAELKVL